MQLLDLANGRYFRYENKIYRKIKQTKPNKILVGRCTGAGERQESFHSGRVVTPINPKKVNKLLETIRLKRGAETKSSTKKTSKNKSKSVISFRTACPICGRKLTQTGFEQHRKHFHSELNSKEFEKLVIVAIKNKTIKVTVFEPVISCLSSGTAKLEQFRLMNKHGYSSMQQGGKVSPK